METSEKLVFGVGVALFVLGFVGQIIELAAIEGYFGAATQEGHLMTNPFSGFKNGVENIAMAQFVSLAGVGMIAKAAISKN